MQHDKKPDSKLSLLRRFANLCEHQVLAFARDSARGRREEAIPLVLRYGLEAGASIGILAFFLTLFVPVILFQAARWNSYQPDLEIPTSRWLVLFEGGPECAANSGSDCFGHPENLSLWESPLSLSDSDHIARAREAQQKRFWMGLELKSEEITFLRNRNASMLGFGMMNAGYRVFINGNLVDEGTGRDILPVTVRLPILEDPNLKSLKVAVEIEHNLGSRIPTWVVPGSMSGVFNFENSKAMLGYWSFALAYRPLFNSLWSLLFAFAFFALWMSVPKKEEYFYFSTYMFVYGLIQTLPFAPIAWGADRKMYYEVNYWLTAFEGTLGALLGISYSRALKKYHFWACLIGLIVAVGGYFSSADHVELYLFKDALMKFYIPVMFLVGSAFCFAQMALLRKEWQSLMTLAASKRRQNRLLNFGVLLLLFGLFFFFNSSLMSLKFSYLDRTIQMVLLGLIGINLMFEYRDREKQFEIVQRSPFHDPFGGVSNEVFGYMVSVDLIQSSVLTNHAAQVGLDQRPVTLWNSHVGQLFAKFNGLKVGDEGDGLKVFFRKDESASALLEVVSILSQVALATVQLEVKMKEAGLIPSKARLNFRAGVVWGGINPIWKEYVGVKSAEWEDARGFSTFKNVQRVMDLEKSLSKKVDGSMLAIIATSVKPDGFASYDAEAKRIDIKDVGLTNVLVLDLLGPKNKSQVA